MPLPKLVPGQGPAPFDVQDTAFTYDVLGRYVCNTWEEIQASQDSGGYPFDAVVLGAGMFGGYIAEKLYRLGTELGLRILIIEAGRGVEQFIEMAKARWRERLALRSGGRRTF